MGKVGHIDLAITADQGSQGLRNVLIRMVEIADALLVHPKADGADLDLGKTRPAQVTGKFQRSFGSG